MNKDSFVVKNSIGGDTLQDQIHYYNMLQKTLNSRRKTVKTYQSIIDKDLKANKELNFKEQYFLYKMIEDLIKKNYSDETIDKDFLLKLKEDFLAEYPIIRDYYFFLGDIKSIEKLQQEILKNNITFNNLPQVYKNNCCINKHFFTLNEDGLECMSCGATVDFNKLSLEEKTYLLRAVIAQGLLIEDVKEETIPLVKVLLDQIEDQKKEEPKRDVNSASYLDDVEKQWLEEQDEIPGIKRNLAKALLLDRKEFNDPKYKVRNPEYISCTDSHVIRLSAKRELEKIEKSDSRFKNLLKEECLTAIYEALILEGYNIPELYKEITTEEEKNAFVKAYYNLSNTSFRLNSQYFKNENDAVFYDCLTANPDINNRLLKMKVRR